MTVSVPLPALGESVTEGTVTRWLKNVGDTVEADEPLLEIATDKVDTEIPSPAAGVLISITVTEDETVEVGAELAVIGQTEEASPLPAGDLKPPGPDETMAPVPEAAPPVPAPDATPPVPAPDVAPPASVPYVAPPVVPYVAPPVPSAPQPSAPPLFVRETPAPTAVTRPVPATPSSSLRGQTAPLTRNRRLIGDDLKKALQEQAQLTTFVEADVTSLMRLRSRAREDFAARTGVKLSPFPFFVKAAAQALKTHPVVNARLDTDAGTITYFDTEDIGIAVGTGKGLTTPVIKAAGDLSIAGIARVTTALADKARTGLLTPDDVSGATFTVSHTGSRGALFDTVIVPLGQAATLGVGNVVKRPAIVEADGSAAIGIRDMVFLSLSYDHRLVDGADAARYLGTVKTILESDALGADLMPVTRS
ncbi:2-oxo acid dehydrogenase subunit E2 [Streptomyces sp. NPDC096311]|uniref:2-oxo acid dehydrogenase subunit E2 n=1 Tax=Streptomyces sp. NPDC096311 TaxID=3366083 RepID=UPI0038179C8F